ncbi:hypothetical protein cyc_02653 [Cyclospora cayetanensis]|uniref:Uncharacterized protein n=1 Tax=Cyclospora cayetanensis TaxID=88456 RepID=A0A1D3CVM2_9EIME|nr:hypothetical protein cyc_02653 [Cyclospora cayetanensis]
MSLPTAAHRLSRALHCRLLPFAGACASEAASEALPERPHTASKTPVTRSFPRHAASDVPAAQRKAPCPPLQRCCFSSLNFLQKFAGSSSGVSQRVKNSAEASPIGLKASGGAFGIFDTMMAIERKGRDAVSALVDREGRMHHKQQLLMQQFYVFYVKQLMVKQGSFALEDFLTLKRDCEDELGGLRRKAARRLESFGLQRFSPEESKELKQFKLEVEILESLSPSELRLTCPSLLSPLTRKAIAASAGVTLKHVEDLLLQFSTMQGDRHWFMRLLELELRLPYGETFYSFEFERTRKLLGVRGDGRGDRRRQKNQRNVGATFDMLQARDTLPFVPSKASKLPQKDEVLRNLLQKAAAAEESKRLLLPPDTTHTIAESPEGRRSSDCLDTQGSGSPPSSLVL